MKTEVQLYSLVYPGNYMEIQSTCPQYNNTVGGYLPGCRNKVEGYM